MKHHFSLTILFLFVLNTSAQVGINTDNSSHDPSAMLDAKSTTKGMLVPRITSAKRTAIGSPATDLLVFDTSNNSFWFCNGTA